MCLVKIIISLVSMHTDEERILLSTDKCQMITHQRIIGKSIHTVFSKLYSCTHNNYTEIGEGLRKEYEQIAEDRVQRAIACTEEVVRREERAKWEAQLSESQAAWHRERKDIFKEAHENQLRAVAKQSEILERKLRTEFADRLCQLQEEHRLYVSMQVQDTWEKGVKLKEEAVAEAREQEQVKAMERAKLVADGVEEEKRRAAEVAEEEKAEALKLQELRLAEQHKLAMERLQGDLEQSFGEKLGQVNCEHEAKLLALQERCDEQARQFRALECELAAMTGERDHMTQKHSNLKLEFSHFIDQFPGFKGDFLLH